MGLTWSLGALPGILAFVTGTSMAVLVYWTRPDRSQNRRLALLLALEGISLGALGVLFLVTTKPTAAGLIAVLLVAALLRPWAYLAFLATLDSPLVDWLDRPAATWGIVVGAGVSAASYVAFRDLFVGQVVPRTVLHGLTEPGVISGYVYAGGPLEMVMFGGLLAVALFGLVVAWSMYRGTSEGSARRSTARSYLAAFGVRDTLNVVAFVSMLVFHVVISRPGTGISPLLRVSLAVWVPQVGSVAFTLLLAYGILKSQLFEIDLKLKWSIEKGTVAAVFVAVFFAVSEGAQILFADFAGNELLGVGAAALLVFLLSPLQRLAERVGDAAMPGVEDTEAYRQGRKEEIYRAQLEELMADEQITKKERRALHRLQDDLGLDGDTANRLEREVLGASGGEAP